MSEQRIQVDQIKPSAVNGEIVKTVAGVAAWAAESAAADHNHTSAGGDGGVQTNDEHDGYSEYTEIAAPSSPAANKVRLYAKDNAGTSALFYKGDDGAEVGPLGSGGGGGGGAPTTAEYITSAADATLSNEVVIPGLAGSADRAGILGGGTTTAATSEEFDTGTDPLTWSPSAPATHDSDTTVKSHLYLATTDTTERFGYKAWSPGSGAFDARMQLSVGSLNTTANPLVGLIIGDSGNTGRALIQVNRPNPAATSSTLIRAFTYAGGAYTQRGSNVGFVPTAYLRITRDGSNNVSFWYSLDGRIWQLLATQAFTFTVTQVGVWFQNGTASTTAIAAIDWLRTDV